MDLSSSEKKRQDNNIPGWGVGVCWDQEGPREYQERKPMQSNIRLPQFALFSSMSSTHPTTLFANKAQPSWWLLLVILTEENVEIACLIFIVIIRHSLDPISPLFTTSFSPSISFQFQPHLTNDMASVILCIVYDPLGHHKFSSSLA